MNIFILWLADSYGLNLQNFKFCYIFFTLGGTVDEETGETRATRQKTREKKVNYVSTDCNVIMKLNLLSADCNVIMKVNYVRAD